MEERIYSKTLQKLCAEETLKLDARVLVICGGDYDCQILKSFGFNNVTISNLDEVYEGQLSPYEWSHQDAENLTYDDDYFDWAIVHAGLHHCYSPHKAMIEMLRVAKMGILVFEARDNLLINMGKRLGLVADFEIEAVVGNNLKKGGVNNSDIPNYVYRWTENEVVKIVKSYFPEYQNNKIRFFYNLRLPLKRLEMYDNKLILFLARSMKNALVIFTRIFPNQCNEFGFLIIKGNRLQDWLLEVNEKIVISKTYVNRKFS